MILTLTLYGEDCDLNERAVLRLKTGCLVKSEALLRHSTNQ